MKRTSWIIIAVAAVLVAASTLYFWLNRPEWGYCIEEGPNRGCETGQFSANAVAGTIAVVVGLALLVLGVLVARGRAWVIPVAIAAFAVLLVVGWVLQITPLEEVPMPVAPHVS